MSENSEKTTEAPSPTAEAPGKIESAYEARRRKMLERLAKAETPEQKKKRLKEQVDRMQAKLRMKKEQKAAVQKKVDLGMPITEAERELLMWVPGRNRSKDVAHREQDVIAAASKLLIQPKHVKELRVLVEQTAAKHSYNPIEELILMTRPQKDEQGNQRYLLAPDDRAGIHKALLPFLVPQIKAAPTPAEDPTDTGPKIKVVIAQYEFNDEPPPGKIYEQKPVTVDTTPTTPPSPDQPPAP